MTNDYSCSLYLHIILSSYYSIFYLSRWRNLSQITLNTCLYRVLKKMDWHCLTTIHPSSIKILSKALPKYQDGSNILIKAGIKSSQAVKIQKRRVGSLSMYDVNLNLIGHASQEVHQKLNTHKFLTRFCQADIQSYMKVNNSISVPLSFNPFNFTSLCFFFFFLALLSLR